VLGAALEHFGCQAGTVHLLRGGVLELAAHRNIPPAVIEIVETVPIGKGLAGLAAERREPITICNLQTDTSGLPRPGARATDMQGSVAVPMLTNGELRGVLGIARVDAYDWPPAEVETLSLLAAALAARLATSTQGGLYVVMGVAGSGKSAIGALLAHALGVEFVEGDAYHSPENVARMSAGVPLGDEDRRLWLAAIAARLDEARRAGLGLVVACSALKRRYRDVLRAGNADVQFVYLNGARVLLEQRLAGRRGHFMPASLLDSQLADLEPPAAEEHALVCEISDPPEAIVAGLVARRRLT